MSDENAIDKQFDESTNGTAPVGGLSQPEGNDPGVSEGSIGEPGPGDNASSEAAQVPVEVDGDPSAEPVAPEGTADVAGQTDGEFGQSVPPSSDLAEAGPVGEEPTPELGDPSDAALPAANEPVADPSTSEPVEPKPNPSHVTPNGWQWSVETGSGPNEGYLRAECSDQTGDPIVSEHGVTIGEFLESLNEMFPVKMSSETPVEQSGYKDDEILVEDADYTDAQGNVWQTGTNHRGVWVGRCDVLSGVVFPGDDKTRDDLIGLINNMYPGAPVVESTIDMDIPADAVVNSNGTMLSHDLDASSQSSSQPVDDDGVKEDPEIRINRGSEGDPTMAPTPPAASADTKVTTVLDPDKVASVGLDFLAQDLKNKGLELIHNSYATDRDKIFAILHDQESEAVKTFEILFLAPPTPVE